MKVQRLLTVALLLCIQITIANAAIISGYSFTTPFNNEGNGEFMKILPGFDISDPQNTVGNNNFESPNLWGFDEDPHVAIGMGGLLAEIGGLLAPGTLVASHYLFFDPKTLNENDGYYQRGWVSFDTDILAIFTSKASLFASDYLANTGVTYLNPNQRGLEPNDAVWIDPIDPKKVQIEWRANTPGDYVRVLTKSSQSKPVPDSGSSIAFMVLGLVLSLAICRIRR